MAAGGAAGGAGRGGGAARGRPVAAGPHRGCPLNTAGAAVVGGGDGADGGEAAAGPGQRERGGRERGRGRGDPARVSGRAAAEGGRRRASCSMPSLPSASSWLFAVREPEALSVSSGAARRPRRVPSGPVRKAEAGAAPRSPRYPSPAGLELSPRHLGLALFLMEVFSI